MGVIENDFHDRKDLTPNICAVYTEEKCRNLGIAGKLLNMAVEDLRSKGVSPVYLVTDHTGFYEKYGFKLEDKTEEIVTSIENVINEDSQVDQLLITVISMAQVNKIKSAECTVKSCFTQSRYIATIARITLIQILNPVFFFKGMR